jgi:hypothetical protein
LFSAFFACPKSAASGVFCSQVAPNFRATVCVEVCALMPYKCDVCEKNFGTEEKRERHKLRKHPGAPSSPATEVLPPEREPRSTSEAKSESGGARKRKEIKLGRVVSRVCQTVLPDDDKFTASELAEIEEAVDETASAVGFELQPSSNLKIKLSGWYVLVYPLLVFLALALPRLIEQARQEREHAKKNLGGSQP